MASDTPQHPIPYSSLTENPRKSDTGNHTVTDYSPMASLTLSQSHRTPSGTPTSPSKRRWGSRTTPPPPKQNRKGSAGAPAPCYTPTNSPEKVRSMQSSPGSGRSSRRLNKGFSGGGYQHQRVRAPGSPPTPYATSGRDKPGFYGLGQQDYDDAGSGYFGISKLNLSLSQAERTKEDLAAATFSSGGEYTMQLQGTPGFFGSMEERQKRYRELNQMRIRNWERFYGDMDGQREGGGLRNSGVGKRLVGLRGGRAPGLEDDLGHNTKMEGEKRTEGDANTERETEGQEKGQFVPVKFVLDVDA
ncbi:hypothetical protein BGX38DRAFT_1166648 [Terfezia claveryi]|nr:hypothetical protein BGX38DRAFT_1166648 [Terfezia claveryi]